MCEEPATTRELPIGDSRGRSLLDGFGLFLSAWVYDWCESREALGRESMKLTEADVRQADKRMQHA